MLAGSRPALRAASCSCAIPCENLSALLRGNSGLDPIGYHASPSVAVRRSAAGLSPPTQTGGCGFCTGLGMKLTLSNWAYLPSKRGLSSVHRVLNTRRYSSVSLPRSANGGAPMARNSSSIQPAPTPTVTRPCESTSSVASALAVNTGGRCGTTITELSRRILDVAAARNAMTVNVSRQSPSPTAAILREALYG